MWAVSSEIVYSFAKFKEEQEMKSIKRKGFTLVELLIVIVVIGILSAMMMLSSTEAVSSAKASNIVTNLRNLKTAALACYVDSLDYFASADKVPTINDVVKYLNNGSELPEAGNYDIVNKDGDWYIMYAIQGSTSERNSIKQKLAGRASSLGLKGSTGKSTAPTASYTNQDAVGMQVR